MTTGVINSYYRGRSLAFTGFYQGTSSKALNQIIQDYLTQNKPTQLQLGIAQLGSYEIGLQNYNTQIDSVFLNIKNSRSIADNLILLDSALFNSSKSTIYENLILVDAITKRSVANLRVLQEYFISIYQQGLFGSSLLGYWQLGTYQKYYQYQLDQVIYNVSDKRSISDSLILIDFINKTINTPKIVLDTLTLLDSITYNSKKSRIFYETLVNNYINNAFIFGLSGYSIPLLISSGQIDKVYKYIKVIRSLFDNNILNDNARYLLGKHLIHVADGINTSKQFNKLINIITTNEYIKQFQNRHLNILESPNVTTILHATGLYTVQNDVDVVGNITNQNDLASGNFTEEQLSTADNRAEFKDILPNDYVEPDYQSGEDVVPT